MTTQKKKAKKRTPKQKTLGLKVKTDAVGKAARKYVNARTIMFEAKEDAETAASTLVKIMREKKRKDIKVDGMIITLKHVEAQDALAIKKVKQPK